MSIRLPIGPAAALFGESAADFAPAPAERIVRYADTPVDFPMVDDQIILIRTHDEAPQKPVPGRKVH